MEVTAADECLLLVCAFIGEGCSEVRERYNDLEGAMFS